MCYVPSHHATSTGDQIVDRVPLARPASPTMGSQEELSNHYKQYLSSADLGESIMHHPTPVHTVHASDIVAVSGRCANGDSKLKSSETDGGAADRLVITTNSPGNRCSDQWQDSAPVVTV